METRNTDIMSITAGFELNVGSRQARIGGETIKLTPMACDLLHFFIDHPDKIFTREELAHQVWNGAKKTTPHAIDIHIRKLRKALKPYQLHQLIQTVHRVGFRFCGKL